MTRQQAIDLITNIFRSSHDLKPRIPLDAIQLETRFKEDLGFDSIAMASLFFELQDQFSKLNETQVSGWKTLNDCVHSVIESNESS